MGAPEPAGGGPASTAFPTPGGSSKVGTAPTDGAGRRRGLDGHLAAGGAVAPDDGYAPPAYGATAANNECVGSAKAIKAAKAAKAHGARDGGVPTARPSYGGSIPVGPTPTAGVAIQDGHLAGGGAAAGYDPYPAVAPASGWQADWRRSKAAKKAKSSKAKSAKLAKSAKSAEWWHLGAGADPSA